MSQSYNREPAIRTFLAELQESTHEFKDGDSEMSPRYVLLPSGRRANRVLIGGTLTSVESDDGEFWRARVNDGTGEISVVAGQYQPEASQKLSELSKDDSIPPAYVLVVGKPDVYTEDESSIVSVKAESIRVITEAERSIWISSTLKDTQDRLDDGEDSEMAEQQYGSRTEWIDDELFESLQNTLSN